MAGTRQDHPDSRSRWPPPSLRPTGGLIQLNRFATIGPVLPSGCSPPHPQKVRRRPCGGPTDPPCWPPLLSTASLNVPDPVAREHRPSSTRGMRFWRRTGLRGSAASTLNLFGNPFLSEISVCRCRSDGAEQAIGLTVRTGCEIESIGVRIPAAAQG